MHVDVLLIAAAGILATLLGLGLGLVLTRRQQVDAWPRARQVDACAAVVRASTYVRRALRDRCIRRITQVDPEWRPWTEALPVVDLLAYPEVLAVASVMDEAIWRASYATRDNSRTGEEAWAQ